MDKINKGTITAVILGCVLGIIIGISLNENRFYGKHMKYGDDYRFQKNYMGDKNMMDGMHGSMQGMMMDLVGKTGDELDKAFLTQMIIHHEGALEMAKTLKEGTKRPELQKMADDIITVQSKEIEMMEDWLKTWFPNNI